MFLTRSEYGTPSLIECHFRLCSSGPLDRGVNTFSPEGRLFQGEFYAYNSTKTDRNNISVEYAIEAIKVRNLWIPSTSVPNLL